MKAVKLFTLFTLVLFMTAISIGEAAKPEELLLYFPFDEGSGKKVKDLSDNGFAGELNAPKWADGKFRKALEFNGTSDFVGVDPIGVNPDELTVELWFKPGGAIKAGVGRQDLIYRRNGSGRPHVTFDREGDGKLGFYIYLKDTSSHDVKTNISSWSAGKWYHVAGTSQVGELKIYINGKLENTKAAPRNPINVQYDTNGISIGARQASQTFFKGGIDEVRLWSRVLSADEAEKAFKGTLLAVEAAGKLATTWGKIKESAKTR